jgi:hypothetical protein
MLKTASGKLVVEPRRGKAMEGLSVEAAGHIVNRATEDDPPGSPSVMLSASRRTFGYSHIPGEKWDGVFRKQPKSGKSTLSKSALRT